MDFAFTEDEELFRLELRAFLDRELPQARKWDRDLGVVAMTEDEWRFAHEFERKLARKGWLCMHWPREYGGQSASQMKQIVYQEELASFGVPSASVMAVNIIAPAIMAHASETQKQHYLPPIAAGEAIWCQGFSEPDAGSDLAALKTTATRTAAGWVISGTKLWSSGARFAEHAWVLARTDRSERRHKGLSTFAVDMRTPGITVRPIATMLDSEHFCEIRFEDAIVPEDALVGVENRGWYQAMTTLSFERSGILRVANLRRVLDELTRQVRERNLGHDPVVRQSLAELATDLEAARLLCYRVAWMQSRGLVPEHEASISRVFGAELSQRMASASVDIIGVPALLRPGDPDAALEGLMERRFLAAISHTLMAGTSEIQRNIIAQRGLGLPRE